MSSPDVTSLLLAFSFGVSLPVLWLAGRWVTSRMNEIKQALYVNALLNGVSVGLGAVNFAATTSVDDGLRFRSRTSEARLNVIESAVETLVTLVKRHVEQRPSQHTSQNPSQPAAAPTFSIPRQESAPFSFPTSEASERRVDQ